ncbi:hypothetical protein MTO96_004791 [Rhipicephalus appendiculatus]
MENLEKLERKVALLQRFNKTAKDHAKALEGLRDTIVERVDELHQFDQSLFADQLYRTVDLSQDGPSDSVGSRELAVAMGPSQFWNPLKTLWNMGDHFVHTQSQNRTWQPVIQRRLCCQILLILVTSDDLDETLKPSLVVGATEPSDFGEWQWGFEISTHKPLCVHLLVFALFQLADSTEQDASDELNQARKSDMAVGDANETELDDTLSALEYAGDMFHGKSEELRRLLQKFKKDGIPENPVKQCLKYWMKLVGTLQSSCITREEKMRQQRRLSAEWTSEDFFL